MLQVSSIDFLKALSKNNNKPWFDAHRKDYDSAKADFENFVGLLLKKSASFDKDLSELEIKQCTFRINRDIRFSKDKTPYKNNMGASLNRGGKKSVFAGYYFHLEPGGKSFAGGGLWMPEAETLKKIRQEVDYNLDEFKTIIENKAFKKAYQALENTKETSLSSAPRGYEKDNPAFEWLKLKSFIATKPLPDKDIVAKDLEQNVIETFKALKPLLDFLNRAID
ncbi:MAG: DUF2461 domain-containing protein [Ginsengibacter sp.]